MPVRAVDWARNRLRRRTASDSRRRELWIGVGAMVVAVAVMASVGILSVWKVGRDSYTAYAVDAQSISVGDEIRVAGLPVGSVTSLDLEPDRVRIGFSVDREVPVGDESSMQVRMLTVVGGHYISLTPAGAGPLGDGAIPVERVQLPYSLNEVFEDAIAPITELDGEGIGRSMEGIGDALATSPSSVRRMVDGLSQFAESLDRQKRQISQVLELVDEYSAALEQSEDQLAKFVRSVNQLETAVLGKQNEMRHAGALTVSAIQRLSALDSVYQSAYKPLMPLIAELVPAIGDISGLLDDMLASVRTLSRRAEVILSPGAIPVDDSGRVVAAEPVCVPVPGRVC